MRTSKKEVFLSKFGTSDHVQAVMNDNKRATGSTAPYLSNAETLAQNPSTTRDQIHTILKDHAEYMGLKNPFHDEELNSHYIDNPHTTVEDIKPLVSHGLGRLAAYTESKHGHMKLAQATPHEHILPLARYTPHPDVIRKIAEDSRHENTDYHLVRNPKIPSDVARKIADKYENSESENHRKIYYHAMRSV